MNGIKLLSDLEAGEKKHNTLTHHHNGNGGEQESGKL